MNNNYLRKVGIVGVGHVGAHCAFSLVTQGIVDELVLVDINDKKLTAEVQDLLDSVTYLPHKINVVKGTYEDLAHCDIIVNSVGKIPESLNRLDELQLSIDMVDSYIERIMKAGFDGIIINITNPCDIISKRIYELSGLPKNKIFGTGTGLDTSRFKAVLSRETGVDHKSIQAYMLGEHGSSQFCAWSQVYFGGKPLKELETEKPEIFGHLDKEAIQKEVVNAGIVTLAGKGATEFAIASTLSRIVNCIYHDEKQIFPCSTLLNGEYGQKDIFVSTPCIVGRNGIEEVLKLNITDDELKSYENSCSVIREYISKIK